VRIQRHHTPPTEGAPRQICSVLRFVVCSCMHRRLNSSGDRGRYPLYAPLYSNTKQSPALGIAA
jgi:hypothetical protein